MALNKSIKKPKKWPRICMYIALGLIVIAIGLYSYLCAMVYSEFGAMKDYYGEKFDELYSLDSLSGEITDAVVSDVEVAFSYTGNDTEQFGLLSRYCMPDAIKHVFKVDLLASGTAGSERYVWIAYTSKAYDGEGNLVIAGSEDNRCLARLTIETIDGELTVTKILEHP